MRRGAWKAAAFVAALAAGLLVGTAIAGHIGGSPL